MADNKGSSAAQLPKLDTGNFTGWYDTLKIHEKTIEVDSELVASHTANAYSTTEAMHQKKLDQLRKAIMLSFKSDVVRMLRPTYYGKIITRYVASYPTP